MLLFEFALRDTKKLVSLMKTCEIACSHSDTAMLKIKPKGVYIMLTDMESFSCLEIRLLDVPLKLHCEEYTVKIILDSFASILRTILKHKHSAVFVAEKDSPLKLQIRQVNPSTNKIVETHVVETAEHRARVFHVCSTTAFRANSDYVEFRIPCVEFNKIITMQCIISGNCGGVGEIKAVPDGACAQYTHSSCAQYTHIQLHVKNHGGMGGGVTIHATSPQLIHSPKADFETKYLLTYLKRVQNLFANPTESMTIIASKKGVLLQTDVRDGHSVLVFIADVSNEDLQSYA
jgi:hypothetical protein